MDSAAATRAPPHLRGLGRLPAWLPGESPPPPDAVFSIGIFLIPYGQTALQPAASALKELKQSLRQHAMADVNQWTPPAVAQGASFDSAGHANALPVAVSVTNFRVALTFPRHPHRAPLTVPLASIGEVAKGRSGGGVFWADLVCKTPLVLRIACDSEVRANNVAREIVVRVPRRVKDTFAYAAQQQQPHGLQRDVGWGIYNAEAELTRLAGRRADITLASLHDPCFATYPTTVMVPAAAAPELLTEVARYRQNARIPMISWADGSGTATLARCSQPLVGAGRRSRADEALLGLLVGFRFDQQQNAAANLSTSDVAAVSPPPPANNSSSTSVAAAAGAADDGSPTSRSAKLQAPMSPAVTPGPSRGSGDASSNRTSPAPTAATKATTRPPPSLFGNDSFATTALMQQAASANDVSELDGADGPRSRRGSGAAPATPPPQAPQQRTLHVVDCRSRAAAAANSAAGGGHELTAYYPRAVSHFLSLANIHKVAKSYLAVRAVCANAQAALSAVGWSTSRSQSEGFWPRLSQSEWPLMTVKLLCAANRVADLLTIGDSVVVHCTDGWDRTSQVTSLAMLLLDPYYRSVSGFCVLIEQEWLRAGHRFSDRCAADSSHHVDPHGGKMNALLHKLSTTFDLGSDSDPDAEDVEPVLDTANSLPGPFSGSQNQHCQQDPTDARGIKPVASPVFIQFLDAVFQLLRQFPTAFEFTPAFLRLLAEECYGGRFGTFLGNTHRARHERQRHASATTAAPSRPSLPAYAATPSLWTFVAQRLVAERDAMRCAAPFCGGNGTQAAANSPWGWAESDPLADSGIIDRDGRQPLLNPLYEAPDETPDQRVVRQLGQFGFPHSVIHAAAAAAKEAADAARAAQQATTSQQQQAPATPPPAQPLPPEDGTRVPLARAAERRLVPSFHTKRYSLWASLFLSGDFDAPSDLHPPGALAPSSASLAALEVPGAAPHVTAMAAAAAACRAGLTGQAPATSGGGIGTADPTTAVLSVFPCAITDAEDFNRLNTVPPLPSPQVAGATGVGESPGAEDGVAASPSPALGTQQQQQQPPPPLADVGASPGIVAPSPLLEGSQNVPGSALLLERGESQDAIFFIPREDAAVCYICEAGFNLWSRRHTCRMCARSVCGRCGGHYAVLARGQIALKEEKHLSGQKLRVCSNCVIKYRTTTTSAAGTAAAGSGAPGARRDPGDAPRAAQPREERRDSGGGGADGAASDTPPEPALTPRSTAVFHAESPPNHLDSPPSLAAGKPR